MSVEVVAQDHPLRAAARFRAVQNGATVAEIVAGFDLDPRYGPPVVELVRGTSRAPLPADMWRSVRPKPGTRVEVGYRVHGAAIGALAASFVSSAAPWIATNIFGLGTSGFLFNVGVAVITVVGGLLINALIPPPQQPSSKRDDENFVITGVSNRYTPYGVYPKVLGRHRMFPVLTARGYSETISMDEIYFRGRMSFGWGPVAIEDLRIGTTPITEFEGVEIEFVNVDESETLALSPELAGITRAFRTGTETLTIYPDNVIEDSYNVGINEQGEEAIRVTRDRTESASIDISFPRGLYNIGKNDGEMDPRTAQFEIAYRALGASEWTVAREVDFRAKTTALIRFTEQIDFPAPGEYEIRVTRLDEDPSEDNRTETAFLTAIRSFRSGILPSHDNIAEIAFKLKATDELNGVVDQLNAVVHQMAPIWDGAAWTAPQRVRHPAWIYLDGIRGPHLRRPVADEKILLDDFKAWADEEPHWTCDYVVDAETRVAEVLDIIASAGRAQRTLTDLRYSIVRDGADGPVRQVFSPRNSWGFKGNVTFPREIHGLRCIVRSERLGWEQDEVLVYADGYDESNATEIETLELPATVITSADNDEGNAWRLGRYHLAAAILRPESFEWMADIEHIRLTRGDKVRFVHDVPSVGVGAGRIKAIDATGSTLTTITLDEVFDFASDTFRLTARTEDGTLVSWEATSPAAPEDRVWTTSGTSPDAAALKVGDMVLVEELEQESLDLLVTGIFPEADGSATIRAVPAAPAVLEADSGVIPSYAPIVTPPRDTATRGPALPVVRGVLSGFAVMRTDRAGVVHPRLAVEIEPVVALDGLGAWRQIRWREALSGESWSYGPLEAPGTTLLYTGDLEEFASYEVEVRAVGDTGLSRGWVSAGTHKGVALGAPPAPVTGLTIEPREDTAVLRWDGTQEPDIAFAEVRYSPQTNAVWQATTLLDRVAYPGRSLSVPSRAGTYMVKWRDWGGRYSTAPAAIYIDGNLLSPLNAVEVVDISGGSPAWDGVGADTEVIGGDLRLKSYPDGYPSTAVWNYTPVTDLGQVYPVQITIDMEARGFSISDSMASWTSLADLASLASSQPQDWNVRAEVSTFGAVGQTEWSEWREISSATITGRYFRFRLVLLSEAEGVAPVVESLAITIDMPDRVQGDRNVTADAAGTSITFDPQFYVTPSIVVTPVGASSGDRVEITNEAPDGFDVRFFDNGGTGVERVFNWTAVGYGRGGASSGTAPPEPEGGFSVGFSSGFG